MKTRSSIAIAVSLMSIVLVVAGCGGSNATTTSSSPVTTTAVTTSNPPTTSATGAAASSTPLVLSSISAGVTLSTTPSSITTHTAAQLASYKGLCLMCHGTGTTNAFPATPSWNGAANGSTVNKGTYTVTAGSPADHIGRTADVCTTQAGCHVTPAA